MYIISTSSCPLIIKLLVRDSIADSHHFFKVSLSNITKMREREKEIEEVNHMATDLCSSYHWSFSDQRSQGNVHKKGVHQKLHYFRVFTGFFPSDSRMYQPDGGWMIIKKSQVSNINIESLQTVKKIIFWLSSMFSFK